VELDETIKLEIEFGERFRSWTGPSSTVDRLLSATIEGAMRSFLDDMGIPGRVVVESRVVPDEEQLQIKLDGDLLTCSEEQVRTLWENYSPVGLGSVPAPFTFADWSRENCAAERRGEKEFSVAFIAELVVEIVKPHAEKLFQNHQAKLFLRRVDEKFAKDLLPALSVTKLSCIRADRLARMLRAPLQQGISLSDVTTVCDCLQHALALDIPDDAMAEILIAALRPDAIAVEIDPAYAEQIFGRKLEKAVSVFDSLFPDAISTEFQTLADEIFRDLGIRVSDILLLPSANVKKESIVVRINHLRGAPRRCPRADQIVVNAPPEVVREVLQLKDLPPFPALNPADNSTCCAIDQIYSQNAKKAGLWIWGAIDYVVLVAKREVTRNAWRILDCEALEFELADLQERYPELVRAVMEKQPHSMLTRICRILLREEISIRNLRAIISRTLNFDYVSTKVDQSITLDDRLTLDERADPDSLDGAELRAQHVRNGLKNFISYKYSRGKNTLAAYQIDDPDFVIWALNHLVQKNQSVSPQARKFRTFLRAKLQGEPPSVSPPAILTYASLRLFVWRLIEDEFPAIPVLAYEELTPDLRVQPLGRICIS
jgi:flagellar biosynthesis component FlhA